LKFKKLKRNFFNKNTLIVAKKLLGKYLVRIYKGAVLAGKIVEVEAYRGQNDPGSHAYRRKTKRNSIMFGPPGFAYVYFCYGNHYLFNIVTEKEGLAGAVLVRALEPVSGIDKMKKNRKTGDIKILTNGPGKLTQAMNIGKAENGKDLTGSEIYLVSYEKMRKQIISATRRIGITQGLDKKWRFLIKGNRFVSVL